MEPINKSLIANFSGKETSFFFKILPKVVFCTTVPEYGHNSVCQKTDLTTFVSQVFICLFKWSKIFFTTDKYRGASGIHFRTAVISYLRQ